MAGPQVENALISSRRNARIKWVRALRQRKVREQCGLFFVEGVRLVRTALERGADIELLIVAPDLLEHHRGEALLAQQHWRGIPRLEVTPEVFESLVTRDSMGGMAAVARQRWTTLAELQPQRGSFWVALDAVQYPGNLGTVLRTANAVGSQGVILLDNATDPYDPASVRASLGAIFSQQLVRARFSEFAVWKQAHGFRLIGTSPGAVVEYQQISYSTPFVLLMGCEREGLSKEQQALCDKVVRIPMKPDCDSLNLAVSTSIVLYEAYQRRQPKRQE